MLVQADYPDNRLTFHCESHSVTCPSCAALHGSDTAIRANAMLVPLLVVFVCGSATSRPYAAICAVMRVRLA